MAKYPDFVQRFLLNLDSVSPGYFSVINELFMRVYGRLEKVGYVMPEQALDGKLMRPDGSVERRFSDWLKEHYPSAIYKTKKYMHKFPNGCQFPANQYENAGLPHFILYVERVWLPEHGPSYFKERDPAALPYLDMVLEALKEPAE
ncbi:MAG: hypothetical protein WAW96_16585 [Alphaproteobacteria bacterium]